MFKNVVCISYVLIIILCSIMTSDIFADSVKVYGTVTNYGTGAALSDAQVLFVSSSGDTTRTVTDPGGEYEVFLDVQTVSVDNSNLPTAVSLGQNFPNPFNPSTTIGYSLEQAGYVQITVYNIMGQTVRQLVNGYTHAGNHRVVWNGTSQDGSSVAAGIYFYRLQTGEKSVVRKMLLLDGGGSFTASHHLTEPVSAVKALAKANAEKEYIFAVKCDGYVTYEDYDFTVSTDSRVDIALEEKHGATIYGYFEYSPCTGCDEDNWNGIIDPINIIIYDTLDYTEKLADITIEYPDLTFEITGLPDSVVDVVIQGDDIISTKKSEIQLSDGEDNIIFIPMINILYNSDTTIIWSVVDKEFRMYLKSACNDSLTAEKILEEYNCQLFSINLTMSYTCLIPENNPNNSAQLIQQIHNDQRISRAYINVVGIGTKNF